MKKFPCGRVVIDLETDGLSVYDGARPFLYGAEDEEGHVLICERRDKDFKRFKKVVEDKTVEKIAHNAKFELKMLAHDGLQPRGLWHDTMIMAHTLNEYEQSIGLKYLAAKYLNTEYTENVYLTAWLRGAKYAYTKRLGRRPNFSDIPKSIVKPYLEKDLDSTMRLFWMWFPDIKKKYWSLYKRELRLTPYVIKMEDAGIKIDIPYCQKQAKILGDKLTELEIRLKILTEDRNFNPGSNQQVAEKLLGMGKTLQKTTKGQWNVEKEMLEMLGGEFCEMVLAFRQCKKKRNTYMLPFIEKAHGNTLHCGFHQCGQEQRGGVKTGRFSSSGPSLHNIPIRKGKDIRRAFIPREDHMLLFADYSQIEMRIFAHYAEDEKLIQGMLNGLDAHIVTMRKIFGEDCEEGKTKEQIKRMRFIAKTVNFAIIYGSGVQKLALVLGMKYSAAKKIREKYYRESPRLEWIMDKYRKMHEKEQCVRDIFGREYRMPQDLNYKGLNAVVQGSAASIMKQAIIDVGKAIKREHFPLTTGIRMTIHDEIAVETPKNYAKQMATLLKKEMEDYTTFKVPLLIDIEYAAPSWGDKKVWNKE